MEAIKIKINDKIVYFQESKDILIKLLTDDMYLLDYVHRSIVTNSLVQYGITSNMTEQISVYRCEDQEFLTIETEVETEPETEEGGAEGSSTSSESPPSGSVGRKPYNTRKGKGKGGGKGPRHVRSSSGYSSHNDETTFSISHAPSFNERIHPPTRFSDVSMRDFATESEYEKGHKPRGMSKLTREAFQINV